MGCVYFEMPQTWDAFISKCHRHGMCLFRNATDMECVYFEMPQTWDEFISKCDRKGRVHFEMQQERGICELSLVLDLLENGLHILSQSNTADLHSQR